MGFTSQRLAGGSRRVDSQGNMPVFFSASTDATAQRIAMDNAGALLSNAYLAAEQAKARALGALPGRVFTDGERSGRVKIKGHPLTRLVQRRWNPVMTAQTGWQWTSVRRDTNGAAYVRVEWYKGEPVAFWPISVPVETDYDPADTISQAKYKVAPGDKFTAAGTYLWFEILVFPTCISTDGGVTGRSLAELAAAEIGLSINLTRFYSNIIGKGFNPGGWLEHDEALEDDEVRALARKNQILSGPDHSGELRIFDRGLKYHSVGSTMAEADIVKQQEFILQSVARAVYVQPNKVMDFSRATFSNIEEASIEFVTATMTNEVTAIEAELSKVLDAMGQPDNYVKFDLKGLLRGDFLKQMQGFVAGVYGGIYKREEVRDWLELPFVEGTDELLQPAAYLAIDPDTGDAKPIPVAPRASIDFLGVALADAQARIAARVAADGDTPKTREFARTALALSDRMSRMAGVPFDLDNEIEEAIGGHAR